MAQKTKKEETKFKLTAETITPCIGEMAHKTELTAETITPCINDTSSSSSSVSAYDQQPNPSNPADTFKSELLINLSTPNTRARSAGSAYDQQPNPSNPADAFKSGLLINLSTPNTRTQSVGSAYDQQFNPRNPADIFKSELLINLSTPNTKAPSVGSAYDQQPNPADTFKSGLLMKRCLVVDEALEGLPVKRLVNRCSGCRKKVGLTGFRCRCGELFCADHRYSDRHDCSYDYKSAGREAIARENPVVKAQKIVKI